MFVSKFFNNKMIPINNDFEEETNETSQQVVDDETRSQYLMQSPSGSGSGDSTSINDININLNRFKTFKVNNKSKTTTNYKISNNNNNNTNYEHITGIY